MTRHTRRPAAGAKPHRQSSKGFTLVEVIISIAALGIICAVLLRLFVVAGDTNDMAADGQDAELLAASAIETLVCADTLEDGLADLGFSAAGGTAAVYQQETENGVLEIGISNDGGNYPGTLYSIRAAVYSDDRTLAAIETKKYQREGAYD